MFLLAIRFSDMSTRYFIALCTNDTFSAETAQRRARRGAWRCDKLVQLLVNLATATSRLANCYQETADSAVTTALAREGEEGSSHDVPALAPVTVVGSVQQYKFSTKCSTPISTSTPLFTTVGLLLDYFIQFKVCQFDMNFLKFL
ncbi:hypothetical protein J6590_009363 [Homalodisca vitripennis]|nr:hypothetical protein J6590_009363 [Homalodisca vitripennis]